MITLEYKLNSIGRSLLSFNQKIRYVVDPWITFEEFEVRYNRSKYFYVKQNKNGADYSDILENAVMTKSYKYNFNHE